MQMRAGSLVINQKKELLLIYRKGKWDFPKGKVEKNEKKKKLVGPAGPESGISVLVIRVIRVIRTVWPTSKREITAWVRFGRLWVSKSYCA